MRRSLSTATVLVALMLLGAPAAAGPSRAPQAATPTPDPASAQIDAAITQQNLIDAAKQSLTNEIATAQGTQSQLRSLIAANQAQIKTTMAALADAQQRFTVASGHAAEEATIAATARRHEHDDKTLLALYIRTGYSGYDDILTYILAGDSLQQMLERSAATAHAADSTQALVSSVRHDVATADQAEAAAQADANAAAAAAGEMQAQKDSLVQQTTNAQQLIGQLQGQERAAAAEIAAADGQDAALALQIATLRIQQLDDTIAKAEAADWQAAEFYIQNNLKNFPGLDGTQVQLPASGNTTFIWPAPGTVIEQGFGPSPYPFEPPYQGFPHFHTGIDLSGPMGTPIYAAADGIVASASSSTVGYGNHIILAHNDGLLTLYGHLETIVITPGAVVHQGQLIGLMGSTGNSTGPHVHFEVRINNQPTNPLAFLPALPPGASGPPRL